MTERKISKISYLMKLNLKKRTHCATRWWVEVLWKSVVPDHTTPVPSYATRGRHGTRPVTMPISYNGNYGALIRLRWLFNSAYRYTWRFTCAGL